MKTAGTPPRTVEAMRSEILTRFVTFSALAGLLLGIFEAALLRTSPRIEVLLIPDTGYVQWFLAPLLDMACFGFLGLLLGWLAARKPAKHCVSILVAADAALLVTFVALRLRWFHSRIVIKEFIFREDFLIPLAWFAAGLAASLLAVFLLWRPISNLALRTRFRVVFYLSRGLALAGAMAICGIGTFLLGPRSGPGRIVAEPDTSWPSPNVVFIVLDTVRADHLSSYGYARPTTPNIDRLAGNGVLFENAISPASWTLPSHASMFTGLLPHQNGVDWANPLPPNPRTLTEVLRSHGYDTAGVVANYNYCQKGWGFARGFETYVDDSYSFPHNLADTLVGTALIRPIYQSVCRFDQLGRQNAGKINQEVFRWVRGRSDRPFFLFVNYFDCHVPYLTKPPYNHRFGKVSDEAVHKLFETLQSKDPAKGFTAGDKASLITGYDNCLAYLDDQIGRLLEFLRKSPQGRNTIVIITSDHGEAFGEQGWYSHGYNLYREALHVPLIITGPGIPKGMRISRLVRTRDLFSTVLDLAGGGRTPFGRESLTRFWNSQFTPEPFDDFVVSEVVPIFNEAGKEAMISLTTPEWQYIYNSSGRQELYHWTTDPIEQTDLAAFASAQTALKTLRKSLLQVLANSSEPWRDPTYLFVHSDRGNSFLSEIISARQPTSTFSANRRLFIGASQAPFGSGAPLIPVNPAPPDQDCLKSLPYH